MTRVALVTGAGGGLGGATARLFAEQGERLVLTDVAEDRVKAVADEIVAAGGEAVALAADARYRDQVQRVVDAGVAAFGRIDTLLNAAGGSLAQLTGNLDKPVWELEDDDWRLVVGVNLDGAFNWVRAVAPVMIAQGAGHVILVASGTGLRPGPNMAGYAAAKAGAIGLMKAAAKDLGAHGVQVNAVNPGLTPHERLPVEAAGPNIVGYTADTMLGRLSSPDEFARFVTALSRLTAISGQTINLDSKILFLMADLDEARRGYEELYGEMPPIPLANFVLEQQLAPDYLRDLERLRHGVFFTGPLDMKAVQLLCFALELAEMSEAAYWHARGARRQGASWEELHKVVEITALLRGLGPSHRGCSVILRLQDEGR